MKKNNIQYLPSKILSKSWQHFISFHLYSFTDSAHSQWMLAFPRPLSLPITFLLPGCQSVSAPTSAPPNAFTQFKKIISDKAGGGESLLHYSEHTKSLMSCLSIHVCCLCLTCIQTQPFGNWIENQAPTPDGVAEQNVTGDTASVCKAQREPRHLADEEWHCWKIRVTQSVTPDVKTQHEGVVGDLKGAQCLCELEMQNINFSKSTKKVWDFKR